MIGLIMAGGLGSRMGGGSEKLLLRFRKPVVLHVVDALRGSGCPEVVAAVSPNAPRTADLLGGYGVCTVRTRGLGYSLDLNQALRLVGGHVLVVPGDLPLLDGEIIRRIISRYDPDRVWTGLLATRGFVESLGLECGFPVMHGGAKCCRTGISLVNAGMVGEPEPVPERYEICDDERVAFNLNTARDYETLLNRARAKGA